MSGVPLVSIIIPAFNAERFLAQTVESALDQTLTNLEIIVVDDGSTDRTAEVIRSFKDRIRAEFNPNRGASAARNRGTELARGRHFQYLDSDDLLLPEAVERRVSALEAAKAHVAYSDWQELHERDEGCFEPGARVARRIEDVDPDPEIATFTSFWAPPAALLYSREIVRKIGNWNESLPVIQDARFLQDAAFAGARFVHVQGVSAQYRAHRGESLSRRDHGAFVRDVLRNACDIEGIWEARGPLNAKQREALSQVFDYAARELFSRDADGFADSLRHLYRAQPGFRLTWPKVAGAASALLGRRGAGLLLHALGRPPACGRQVR